MPGWLKLILALFGALFFLLHVLRAVIGVRYGTTRDQKLEGAGAAVPGAAGLMLKAALLLPPSRLAVLLCVMAVPVLAFGRAVYEVIVFRTRRGREEAP